MSVSLKDLDVIREAYLQYLKTLSLSNDDGVTSIEEKSRDWLMQYGGDDLMSTTHLIFWTDVVNYREKVIKRIQQELDCTRKVAMKRFKAHRPLFFKPRKYITEEAITNCIWHGHKNVEDMVQLIVNDK